LKIIDYLQKDTIFLDAPIKDKPAVFKYLTEICLRNGIIKDEAALYDGLLQREETMSTGVGGGIGFPHTTNSEIKTPVVLLVRLAKGIDFDALDELPVDIIIALIIPETDPSMHVRLLARVSRLCINPEFINTIRQAQNSDELWKQVKCSEEDMTCS